MHIFPKLLFYPESPGVKTKTINVFVPSLPFILFLENTPETYSITKVDQGWLYIVLHSVYIKCVTNHIVCFKMYWNISRSLIIFHNQTQCLVLVYKIILDEEKTSIYLWNQTKVWKPSLKKITLKCRRPSKRSSEPKWRQQALKRRLKVLKTLNLGLRSVAGL